MERSKITLRPWPIIILSIVAFLGSVLGIFVFVDEVSKTGFHPEAIYTFVLVVGLLLPFINIYRMKKSGFYLYGLVFMVAQAFSLNYGNWSAVGLVMPVLVLGIYLVYRKKLA